MVIFLCSTTTDTKTEMRYEQNHQNYLENWMGNERKIVDCTKWAPIPFVAHG